MYVKNDGSYFRLFNRKVAQIDFSHMPQRFFVNVEKSVENPLSLWKSRLFLAAVGFQAVENFVETVENPLVQSAKISETTNSVKLGQKTRFSVKKLQILATPVLLAASATAFATVSAILVSNARGSMYSGESSLSLTREAMA